MPGFVLKELSLISLKEKRARRIAFHPTTTIVKGVNDTGKSSLLKSIYQCFGATPPKIHQKWKAAHVIGAATFAVHDKQYIILQDGKRYTVFDESRTVLAAFDSVTLGLGPYLAGLLNFGLKLTNRENQVVTPPSAYILLPFYIDQDKGWADSWASFANLNQFADWKKDLAEYYTGIRPNEYYRAKGESETLQEEMKPLVDRHDVLQSVLSDLERRLRLAEFSFDIEAYRREIRDLLIACDAQKKREEEIKLNLVRNHNNKAAVEAQLAIARGTLDELQADYNYATKKLLDEHVECPTCGASYANSFAERFSIAQDEDRCRELLTELTIELDSIERIIASDSHKYADVTAEIAEISELLAAKQGDVQLKDIIEGEGRKEVQRIIRGDIAQVSTQIRDLEDQILRLRERMAGFDNKEHRQAITGRFRSYMRQFLFTLEVHTLSLERLFVYSQIMETGSDTPRALLAYYFSILHLISEYSSSGFCPVVIDSPNQQDQDIDNLKKMLTFIRDKRPSDSQLILGLVDDCGIEFGGDVIELSDKYSLLKKDGYEEVAREVRELVEKSLSFSQQGNT